MSGGRYTQSHSAGGSTGTDAAWNVLNGAHIGATWPIRLSRPHATAMRPYVKLLLPFVWDFKQQGLS